MESIKLTVPLFLILENVDIGDESDDHTRNINIILEKLRESGYHARDFVVKLNLCLWLLVVVSLML